MKYLNFITPVLTLMALSICVDSYSKHSLDIEPWESSDDLAKANFLAKWSMHILPKYTMLKGQHEIMNVRNFLFQITPDPNVVNYKFDVELLVAGSQVFFFSVQYNSKPLKSIYLKIYLDHSL